ncbi:septum site-determining protein MinD [Halorubrum aquaticum]|uniref:Septum site-determining protein MinD n=1 Tax=Halorubrum aquaticum TaxID=387340 RepID=A0A1I3BCB4_9EURY|nr:P-loop NTPase [Halorubrum aquaticum]SFH59736.1 septum site-determining protein MinD [Halorubrum aquaticum]
MIAVAGGKGGSGKTTTALGLARAFSRRGAPVVAADADWDLPNLVELADETGEPVATPATPREAIPEATGSRARSTVLRVARGERTVPVDRSAPVVLDAPKRPREHDAATVFSDLDDVVAEDTPLLLDCPAGASPDVAAPLRAADRCVLVTPLHRPALRDAVKTATIARRLGCPPLGVVVTRSRSVPDAVSELFGCPVLGRVPPSSPVPLADAAVEAAYDGAATALVEAYGADRWRIA